MRFLAYHQPTASNDTSPAELDVSPDSFHGWKTLALMSTTLLILFTVCGNAMTLYAVCKMKTFQNSISNLYIASLAAADMIVGTFVMTFMMLYTIAFNGHWVFGPVMCDVWQTVDFVSCTISLYSICAIAFDRWLNLEKPLRIFKRSRLTAKRALALVWILPVVIWTPLMVGFRLRSGPAPAGVCAFSWRPTYVVPIIAVPLFYVPVFVLMILFIRISLVIRSHLIFLHRHSNQNTNISLFDFDRSLGGSPYGSTPASSRRRSAAATPLNGSYTKLNGSATNCGSNFSLNCNGNCRKFKPPPLSPIVSVNVTAMNSSSHNTKTDASNAELDVAVAVRAPNQSPLAMKVLRDRLSPKCESNTKPKLADFPVFDFEAEKSKSPKETTPLIRANSKISRLRSQPAKQGQPQSQDPKKRNSIAVTPTCAPKLDVQAQNRSASPVLFQIGEETRNCCAPTRSDVANATANALVNDVDLKRSSVTSDTAVFFTRRFLNRKPPLLRAKTEIVLETNARKQSARFSIITLTSPLFLRKYSVNIFSDMFPQCTAGIAQQIRAAKAVGVILIFFLVSWAPFLVLWPLKTFWPDCVSDRLYQLSIWANYLNSTLNPILYTLCSPRFQRVFRKRCINRCCNGGQKAKKVEPKKSVISVRGRVA